MFFLITKNNYDKIKIKVGKYMKRVFFIIVFIILLTGCKKDDNTLVLVTEAGFAPYEYYENGEIVGVDIEIANEIAKELGKKLKEKIESN
jgi:ABC-type amino acid transport substrate-binding protein